MFLFAKKQVQPKQNDPQLLRLSQLREALDGKSKSSITVYSIAKAGVGEKIREGPVSACVGQDVVKKEAISTFADLKRRVDEQGKLRDLIQKKIDSVERKIKRYQSDCAEIEKLFSEVRENDRKLREQLMDSASDAPLDHRERELFDRLRYLEREMKKPNKFESALNALKLRQGYKRSSVKRTVKLPDDIRSDAELALQAGNESLLALQEVVKEIKRQITLCEQTVIQ